MWTKDNPRDSLFVSARSGWDEFDEAMLEQVDR